VLAVLQCVDGGVHTHCQEPASRGSVAGATYKLGNRTMVPVRAAKKPLQMAFVIGPNMG
jgi:hypothetical protein